MVSTVLPPIMLAYRGVLTLGLVGQHGAVIAAAARSDAVALATWVILTACVLARRRRCWPRRVRRRWLLCVTVAVTRAVHAGHHAAAVGGKDDDSVRPPA